MTYKYFGTITMDEAWQKVRAGRDYWPVSYTHLTLPTNREV